MPTYVYRCEDCQEQVEVIQRFSDDPLTTCPHCGGTLHRLLFPPAIIFKGTGWYSTDYGRSSSGNGSSAKRTPEKTEADQPAAGSGDDSESIASSSGKED